MGVFFAYIVFSIVNHYAKKFGIEILKSGVYMDKSVSLIDGKEIPDDAVDYRIWAVQVVVWVLCTLIAKLFIFFLILFFHK